MNLGALRAAKVLRFRACARQRAFETKAAPSSRRQRRVCKAHLRREEFLYGLISVERNQRCYSLSAKDGSRLARRSPPNGLKTCISYWRQFARTRRRNLMHRRPIAQEVYANCYVGCTGCRLSWAYAPSLHSVHYSEQLATRASRM